MMLLVDMMDLLGHSVSCSNQFFIISIADATGTSVNSAVRSYEVMHSPSSSLVLFIPSTNSLVLLI